MKINKSRDFATLLHSVSTSRSKLHRLLCMRDTIVPSSYSIAIRWVRSIEAYETLIFNPGFPATASEINRVPLLKAVDINKELKWAISYLEVHGSRLKRFLTLANEYSATLLNGNNNTAYDILNRIEDEFGLSLWLCRRKLTHYAYNDDTEKVKKYLQHLTSNLGDTSGVIKYILLSTGRRLDSSVGARRFLELELLSVGSIGLPKPLHAYLRYNIDPVGLFTDSDIASVLNWESASSVIDYYEAFIWALQYLAAVDGSQNRKPLLDVLNKTKEIMGDDRLELACFRLGLSKGTQTQDLVNIVEVFDQIINGNYFSAKELASVSLQRNPNSIDLRELYCKAVVFTDSSFHAVEKTISGEKINALLASVISKAPNLEDAVDELTRIAYAFHPFPWAKGLLNFLHKELSLLSPIQADLKTIQASSALDPLSPLRISAYKDNNERQHYVTTFNEIFSGTASATYVHQAGKGLEDYADNVLHKSDEYMFMLSSIAVQQQRWNDVITIVTHLSKSSNIYYKQLSWPLMARSHAELLQFAKCVDIVTSTFVQTPVLVRLLPIKETVRAAESLQEEELSGNISVPILYDIVVRHFDKSYTYARSDAFEDFLDSMEVRYASQLLSKRSLFERDKYTYFLRHLAVASVIEPTAVFENADEVRNERLKICQQLLEIDPDHVDVITSEIQDITQLSTIRRRMREVEQSKIYIDVDGIKKSIDQNVSEAFSRYISLLRNDASLDTDDVVNDFKQRAQVSDIEALMKLILPRNEMNDILRTMIIALRDHYVSNSEYGLDGYLSTNIRHGTLLNHLRSPVGAANLVTEVDSTTGEYKSNEVLLEQITDPKSRHDVDCLLKQFSRNFDGLVTQIKDEWIQIDRTGNTPGLFRFAITERMVVSLAAMITEETTFEQFIDASLNLLNNLLNATLKYAQEVLHNKGKNEFYSLLATLETDLDGLKLGADASEVKNAIVSSRTGISDAINRMIGWFKQAGNLTEDPFEIEVAIQIAAESLRAASIPFFYSIKYEKLIVLSLPGKVLRNMVIIFFTLFQNIVKDSKGDFTPTATIHMQYKGNHAHLIIENSLHPGVDHAALHSRLDKIKAGFQEKDHTKALTTEGGTGLIKIRKILHHDLREPSAIFDFRISDNNFLVEIGLAVIKLKGSEVS